MPLNLAAVRRQFPFLTKEGEGHALIYLDSAATAQKPDAVLDAMHTHDATSTGNVHRGMHILAESATAAYEDARMTVQHFIHAEHADEIVFTRGTTESINLAARSFGSTLDEGDVVLLSLLEHHSNIVPWLQLKEERGIDVRWIEIDDTGHINLDSFKKQMKDGRVKLVSITGQSNVLGVQPPIKEMITTAHEHGARVLVDAAQLIGHAPVDVTELDCDFLAFSGHKLYGPTGIGVLYGKHELLKMMPPFLGGGMMIREVTKDSFTTADAPAKFEAGTPPITQAIGLAAAIKWQDQFAWADRNAHEKNLLGAALKALSSIAGLHILGPANVDEISGCISFTIDGMHPHDLADILGQKGICIRAGHHCTQPLHERLNVNASARISLGIYNTVEEINLLPAAIAMAKKKLHLLCILCILSYGPLR